MTQPPEQIRLHKRSQLLELVFGDRTFEMSAEFLRVHSPSAEVRGHGGQQSLLQTGKQFVQIRALEPAGNYALKITFDDGHDSGIYTWDYLYQLGDQRQILWEAYLDRLQREGGRRSPDLIGKWKP
jgi:DUF971 family protein